MVVAVVTEALPNVMFRIKYNLDGDDREGIAYLAGRMRLHRIRVVVGDQVEVVLDSYGGKGRIVKRL